jgi:phosphatidylglycerophosphatase C
MSRSPSELSKPRALTAEQIITELESMTTDKKAGGIAFDGDGTLWSGDVGEEACEHAIERGAIQQAAREALEREARAFDLDTHGSAGAIAKRLVEAFRSGHYPESRVCEMMVWCYAGWTESDVREHVRRTLASPESRVAAYRPLMPIIEWARQRGLRCIVISASPKLVVEEAARSLGFESDDVVAGQAYVSAGRIEPALASPIPYGETKAGSGRAVFGERPWLATFGDNAFDLEMLRAARLPIAVRPKQRLLELFGQLKDAIMFREG